LGTIGRAVTGCIGKKHTGIGAHQQGKDDRSAKTFPLLPLFICSSENISQRQIKTKGSAMS